MLDSEKDQDQRGENDINYFDPLGFNIHKWAWFIGVLIIVWNLGAFVAKLIRYL